LVHKYIKKGGSKYPQKSGQKGREGEDQPSPKLEVMGGIQMEGNRCGGVHGAGGGAVTLWEKGKGGRSGGWGWEGQSDSPLSATAPRGKSDARGVF
jgi:hypothetical protein